MANRLPTDLFSKTTPAKPAKRSKVKPSPRRKGKASTPTAAAQTPTIGYQKPTDLAPRPRPTGRRPAADLEGQGQPVRVTVYLRPDQFLRLRKLAASRPRGDVSMLIREAVDVYLAR